MKTTVWIRLDIEAKPGAQDPFEAVDEVLDDGTLQDAINDGRLKVTAAVTLDTVAVAESLKLRGPR